MYVDGSSNFTGSGVGLIFSNSKGIVAKYALHFEFPVINNEVECEALAVELRIARELGIQNLKAAVTSNWSSGIFRAIMKSKERT